MAMSHSAAHLLVALACALLASGASGFHAAPQPQLAARRLAASRATAAAPCMLAKKKSKKRERKDRELLSTKNFAIADYGLGV